jgi:hypothetical protein
MAPCPRFVGSSAQRTMAFPGRPAVRRAGRAAPTGAKVSYALYAIIKTPRMTAGARPT